MSDRGCERYEFGPFRLVVKERALWNGNSPISMTPKEFDTLYILIQNAGRLVTKDQIITHVWPESFVGDGSLARNISVLRRLLGDGYIQTVPKSGYRFSASVKNSEAETRSDPGEPLSSEAVFPNPAEVEGAKPIHNISRAQVQVSSHSLRQGIVRNPETKYAIRVLGCLLLVITVLTATFLLRKVRGSRKIGAAPFTRILILPVQNHTGVLDQEYVSDGLTEEMISQLGKADPSSLGVIAPATAMLLKGSAKSPEQLGRELHVGYVLVSTLRQKEHRIRISMQLVRVTDEVLMWTAEFEREDHNLFGISNEAASAIEKHFRLRSASGQRTPQDEGTKDNEAYEDYLKGRFFWNKRLKEDVSIATEYFSKAIARDPNYAKAYAGIADSYIVMAGSHLPAQDALARAQESAEKAIFLDDTLAEAHNSLAYVMYAVNWNWADAEKEYSRALELDPQYAVAHHWYFIYLTSMKCYPEAIAEVEKALELDPLSQSINYNAGMTYILANHYDRAATQLSKAIELDPQNPVAYGYLGQLYELEGKYSLAADQFKKAAALEPGRHPYDFELADAYARGGRISDATKLVRDLTTYSRSHYTNPYWFVAMNSGFGDPNKVLPWLDRAIREHSCTALEVNTDPRLAFLRSDPRFQEVTSGMRLPQ
jgi:DNA-binding winged helix-turn-helix (wHTH) protein/TolB-like protein/Tfp pilus assembly protein PilF